MSLETIFSKIGALSEKAIDSVVGAISSNVNYSQEAVVGVIVIILILFWLFRGR